jgi:hypothetical protein
MKNYMNEVAKMLGIKMGEEFEVVLGREGTLIANITNTGLHVVKTNVTFCREDFNETILNGILVGRYRIKHKPWKPVCGDVFYYINSDGEYEEEHWMDVCCDYVLYKLGNCYRTQQEAEANRDKWIAFYNSDEVLEV